MVETTLNNNAGLIQAAIKPLEQMPLRLAIPIAVLTLIFIRSIYLIWIHPLRKIPGPFFAKLTELWRARRYTLGKWHEEIVELHRIYGPVVRISPNEVSFVDKNALVQVYGHTTGTRKTNWYEVWDQPNASKGFFSSTDPKEHAFLRKRVSAAYTMSTILSLEPEIQKVGDLMWPAFDRAARSGLALDIQKWASYFAFDVVCTLGMGGPLGFVSQGTDVQGIIRSIHDMFFISAAVGYLPGQMWWFRNAVSQAIFSILGAKSASAGASFQAWLWKQAEGRMNEPENKERRKDMLDHFISMKDPDGQPVRMPGILIEAGNLVGAGADTTAAGISSVIGNLLTHPNDYRRVQKEVDGAYAAQPDQELDYRNAESLPYLSACVKEAIRLTPSIVWQLPRHAPSGGISIAGHYIPESATLSISPYAHNRCKEIFGGDAEQWRPERYLKGSSESQDEYIKEIEKYNVTFGYGPRTCIGRNLALVEIYKFVGQFARRYDMEAVNKDQAYSTRSQWFVVQDDLKVVLRERKHG